MTIHHRRVRRLARTTALQHGLLFVDGESIDRSHGEVLKDAEIAPEPEHRPDWAKVRHHLSRAQDVNFVGAFYLFDDLLLTGEAKARHRDFVAWLSSHAKYNVILVESGSILPDGFDPGETIDNAIASEVRRVLADPRCPAQLAVATCDGDAQALLARILDHGRQPVLVTVKRRCNRRMMGWCENNAVPVYDLVCDRTAMEGRSKRKEVEAAYSLADPRERHDVAMGSGRRVPADALRAAQRLAEHRRAGTTRREDEAGEVAGEAVGEAPGVGLSSFDALMAKWRPRGTCDD